MECQFEVRLVSKLVPWWKCAVFRAFLSPCISVFWPSALCFTYEPTQKGVLRSSHSGVLPCPLSSVVSFGVRQVKVEGSYLKRVITTPLRITAIINCCLEFDATRSNWQTSRSWSPTQPSISTPLLVLLLVLTLSLNALCPRSLSSWSLRRMLLALEEAEPLHYCRVPPADNQC